MKKTILFFTLTIGLIINIHAQIQNIELKPKGIFSEISVEKQNNAINVFQGKDKKLKLQLIDSILSKPNDYNPPVLYALANELFSQNKKDDAVFWFYTAQLRARYNANLCMDNTAKQAVSILNNTYGPDINKYAFKDIEKLEKIVMKVIDFVRSNNENYDPRWINLHGMWAIESGLSDTVETRELSKPKEEWETIKKKTIDDYYNGFIEYVIKPNK